jgi:hypothetical protein
MPWNLIFLLAIMVLGLTIPLIIAVWDYYNKKTGKYVTWDDPQKRNKRWN